MGTAAGELGEASGVEGARLEPDPRRLFFGSTATELFATCVADSGLGAPARPSGIDASTIPKTPAAATVAPIFPAVHVVPTVATGSLPNDGNNNAQVRRA